MPRVGYSTVGFVDREVEPALDIIAAAGYQQVEILCQDPHVAPLPQGDELSAFRSRLDARGFTDVTLHAPMGRMSPGAPDDAWRQEVVAILADHVRFAGEIEASAVVMHPVPNGRFVAEPDAPDVPGRMDAAARRSLDELVPLAEDAGTRILLENLPYTCAFPLLTMKALRPLVDAYPMEALGLVIDTGHAGTVRLDAAEEIRAAGERLWGTHLQDIDGDEPNDQHWVPGQGALDWDAIRAAMAEVDYRGAWTFEVINGRDGESKDDLPRMCRQVAEAWGLLGEKPK